MSVLSSGKVFWYEVLARDFGLTFDNDSIVPGETEVRFGISVVLTI